ncbi:MAG: hypothetical protein AAF840_01690 [Bacteroidota bacterium]
MTVSVSEAEIKLRLFRWIDQLPEERLVSFFEEVKEEVAATDQSSLDKPRLFSGDLEEGYAAMAADQEGEREAYEWLGGLIN